MRWYTGVFLDFVTLINAGALVLQVCEWWWYIYLYDFCRNSERKRKERAQLVYERKKQLNKLRMKAEKAVEEKLDPHI